MDVVELEHVYFSNHYGYCHTTLRKSVRITENWISHMLNADHNISDSTQMFG